MNFYPILAKPIFTVGVPRMYSAEEREYMMDNMPEETRQQYNIFIYPTFTDHFEFKAFYEKDFQLDKFEDFKNEIKQLLTTIAHE